MHVSRIEHSTPTAYVSIRQHTSAYVSRWVDASAYVSRWVDARQPHRALHTYSIRQHTSACISIRQHTSEYVSKRVDARQPHRALHTYSIRQHPSAYVSSPHTSAYVSIRQHASAYVSIRQHTLAYVSIRQHTSAYSIRPNTRQPHRASTTGPRNSRTARCVRKCTCLPVKQEELRQYVYFCTWQNDFSHSKLTPPRVQVETHQTACNTGIYIKKNLKKTYI
jgi:hypothetical protein